MDILLQSLDGESDELGWNFRYDFGGGYDLRLDVPLDEFGYKGARISVGLDSSGFGFRTLMPIGGGILRVDSKGIIEYQLKRKDVVSTLRFEEGLWKLSFKAPIASNDSKDGN